MSYDQTNQDQLYIEDGYLTPDGYYVYTAVAQGLFIPYIEENYIDIGYYQDEGGFVVLTCAAEVLTGETLEASAVLSAQFVQTSNVSKIVSSNCVITSTASISCVLSNIIGSDMSALSDAALGAQVRRIRDTNTAATAQFDIATDYIRIKTGDADVEDLFSAIVNGLRSREFNFETQAAFSFTTDSENVKGFESTISAEFSQTTSADRIRFSDTVCQSEFTITAITDRIRDLSSTISSTASVSADADRSADAISIVLGEFTLTAEAAQTEKQFTINAVSEFVTAATALKIKALSGVGSSEFTQSAVVNKTATGAANTSTEFTTTQDADRIRGIDSTVSSESTVTVDYIRYKEYSSDVNSTALTSTEALRVRSFNSNTITNTQFTATVSNIAGADIIAANFATVSAQITYTTNARSTMVATSSVTCKLNYTTNGRSTINSAFGVLTSRYTGGSRPVNGSLGTNVYYDSSIFKYGTHSLARNSVGLIYQTDAYSDLQIPNNTNFIFSFHYYFSGLASTNAQVIAGYGNLANNGTFNSLSVNEDSWAIYHTGGVNRALTLRWNNNGVFIGANEELSINGDQWNYIELTRTSSAIRLRIIPTTGITREFTVNGFQQLKQPNSFSSNRIKLFGGFTTTNKFDEVNFRIGTTSGGSSLQTNQDQFQKLLLHFDNNLRDDTATTLTAEAFLQSSFVINGNISGPVKYSANLNTTNILTAIIGTVEEIALTAFADSLVVTAAERLRDNASAQSSEFTQSAISDKLISYESNQSSETTQTADADRIRLAQSDGLVITDLDAEALRTKQISSNQQSFTVQSTIAVKTVSAEIAVLSLFTPSVIAEAGVNFEILLAAEFQSTINGDRLRDNTITAEGEFAVTAQASQTFSATASLASAFTVEASPTGLIDAIAINLGTFTQTADADRIRDNAVVADSLFTANISSDNSRIRYSDSSANLETAIIINGVRIKQFAGDLAVNAFTVTISEKTADGIILTAFNTILTTDVSKITGYSLQLDTQSQIDVSVTRIQPGSADLITEFTQEANGRSSLDAASDVTVTSELIALGSRDRDIDSSLFNSITLSVQPLRIKALNSICNVETNSTVDAQRLRDSVTIMPSAFVEIITAIKIIDLQAVITSAMVFAASVRDLRIDEIEYVIPAEIWEYDITSETRQYTIGSETREFIIQGD